MVSGTADWPICVDGDDEEEYIRPERGGTVDLTLDSDTDSQLAMRAGTRQVTTQASIGRTRSPRIGLLTAQSSDTIPNANPSQSLFPERSKSVCSTPSDISNTPVALKRHLESQVKISPQSSGKARGLPSRGHDIVTEGPYDASLYEATDLESSQDTDQYSDDEALDHRYGCIFFSDQYIYIFNSVSQPL